MAGTAGGVRVLFFDPDPDVCIAVEELADELHIAVATASDVALFDKHCAAFAPNRIVIGIDGPAASNRALFETVARHGLAVPLLLTGRRDISVEEDLIAFAAPLDLDVRGTVMLAGSRRDLQFALLWSPTPARAA